MGKTKIQWTDMSWPVVTGCSHSGSPGCDNCYAARMAATRLHDHPRYKGLATFHNGKARWMDKVRLNHDVLEQPLHWRKPRMVFVALMGDLFHESIPDEFISKVWRTMLFAGQHTFQVLTKRPKRMATLLRQGAIWAKHWNFDAPLPNVWLGTSIENQATADERIPWLLQTPAAVRFVSVEPMLSAVDLFWSLTEKYDYSGNKGAISWVICGGESGPGARPMHPDWARSLRDQCQAAGTPYFFKQWGAWMPAACGDDLPEAHYPNVRHSMGWPPMARVGKKRAGRLLDGQVWDEFPEYAL